MCSSASGRSGSWDRSSDGSIWEHDFDITYTRGLTELLHEREQVGRL